MKEKQAKNRNLSVSLPVRLGSTEITKFYVEPESNRPDPYTVTRIERPGESDKWVCNCEHYYQRLLPLLDTTEWEPCKHIESVWNSDIQDKPEYKIRRTLASVKASIENNTFGLAAKALLNEGVLRVEKQLRADGLI